MDFEAIIMLGIFRAKKLYCVLSRRCICHECEKECNIHKSELTRKSIGIGLSIKEVNEDILLEKSRTSMVHNHKSLTLLPCGYGVRCSACLTCRSGVDTD